MRIATAGPAISEDIATYMQEIADDLAAELEQRLVGRLKMSHRGQKPGSFYV
jgi:N-acetylmuramoyl-L-alanine amidase